MVKAGLLVSYHYLQHLVPRFLQTRQVYPTVPWVLDSGAFSAMSMGTPISLKDYARFIKDHGWRFAWVASLDVIGDPKRTRANWLALRELSKTPVVPCIHTGTDPSEVEWYASRGATRVALGGLVPHMAKLSVVVRNKKENHPVVQWLDQAHAVVAQCGVQVHGFGVGSIALVERWPWTTTDSTAALMWVLQRNVRVEVDGQRVPALGHLASTQTKRAFSNFEVIPVGSVDTVRPARRERILLAVDTMMSQLATRAGPTYDRCYFALIPNNATDSTSFSEAVQVWNG